VAARSLIPRLTDIIEAIERIHAVMGDIPLDVFEADWQRQWLVERGVEIISEASRRMNSKHVTQKFLGRKWRAASGKSLPRGTGKGACPQSARLMRSFF
jgi:uncharacterized protein with HEPN domain